jgi:hypothetical protein
VRLLIAPKMACRCSDGVVVRGGGQYRGLRTARTELSDVARGVNTLVSGVVRSRGSG